MSDFASEGEAKVEAEAQDATQGDANPLSGQLNDATAKAKDSVGGLLEKIKGMLKKS